MHGQDGFQSHAGGSKVFGWEQLPPAQPHMGVASAYMPLNSSIFFGTILPIRFLF